MAEVVGLQLQILPPRYTALIRIAIFNQNASGFSAELGRGRLWDLVTFYPGGWQRVASL